MKTIEISYNPYKMVTKMLINQVDVCRNQSYEKFKDFIENEIPLQTWIEPIEYRDWAGFVNEISDTEINDGGRVACFFSVPEDDVFHRKVHGMGKLDKGINGHLGRADLKLPVIAGADVCQFGHFVSGQAKLLSALA